MKNNKHQVKIRIVKGRNGTTFYMVVTKIKVSGEFPVINSEYFPDLDKAIQKAKSFLEDTVKISDLLGNNP